MSSTSMSSASTEQAPADPHLEPDDMERVTPEHPLGVGQQCFKCGAYNDLDAETCWSCSQPLTETPAATESTDMQWQADTSLPTNDQSQMGAGVLAESQPQIGGIMDTTMSEDTLETEDRPES
jgi:hypothetical protein